MKNGFVVIALVVATVSAGGAIRAQDTTLSDGMDRVNENLEQIARTLRQIRVDQKVTLMIRRIELAERRAAPASSELRSARGEVRMLNDEIAHLDGIGESFRDEIAEATRTGEDPLRMPARSELQHVETMIEVQRGQLEEAERRVIEAENEQARTQKRIAILDDQLDELLEALDEP